MEVRRQECYGLYCIKPSSESALNGLGTDCILVDHSDTGPVQRVNGGQTSL